MTRIVHALFERAARSLDEAEDQSPGALLGLSGWRPMRAFCGLCVAATVGLALLPEDVVRRSAAAETSPVRADSAPLQ